jgi:hypothetical protein
LLPVGSAAGRQSKGFAAERQGTTCQAPEVLHAWVIWQEIAFPQLSRESRITGSILRLETGTVFGTVSLADLEPQAVSDEKTLMKSVVGVTGFEPATPTSRT